MKLLFSILLAASSAQAATYTNCSLTKSVLREESNWDQVGYRMFATSWTCDSNLKIVGGWVEYSRASRQALAHANNVTLEADGPYAARIHSIDGVKVDQHDETAIIPAQHQQTVLLKGQTLAISGSPLVDMILSKRAESVGMKPSHDSRELEFTGTQNLSFSLYSPQLHDFTVVTKGDFAKSMINGMIKAGIKFETSTRKSYGRTRVVTQMSVMNDARQMYESCAKSVSKSGTTYECYLAPAHYEIR